MKKTIKQDMVNHSNKQPAAKKQSKTGSPLYIAAGRYSVFRDQIASLHGRLYMAFIAIGISGLVNVILAAVIALDEPKIIGLGDDGKIIELVPLDEPMVSQEQLLNWAVTAITSAYNISHVHYREQFQKASMEFTKEGWNEFERAMLDSGNIDAMVKRKLTGQAVAQGAPVITREGEFRGRHVWEIEVPVLVSWEGATKTATQRLMVQIVVMRVSVTENRRGVAIQQFIAKPY